MTNIFTHQLHRSNLLDSYSRFALQCLIALAMFSNKHVLAQIPFECSTYRYQVTAPSAASNTSFWKYDPILGERTLIGTLPPFVNAIGYNTLDHFIWGALGGSGGSIIRISADATWATYTIPNLPTTSFNVGDISPDGYMYLYASNDARYYTIDLDSSRPTFLRLVDPKAGYVLDGTAPFGTAMSTTRPIDDWAYNPVDGKLYSVTRESASPPFRLMILDPKTGISTTSSVAVAGGGFQTDATFYGATFFDNDGNFYAVSNATGHFYRINLQTFAATRVSTDAVPVSQNDGAGCPLAPPILTDLGDAPDTYGTLFNSNGPAHILSDNLKIGSVVDNEDDGQPTALANGDSAGINDEDGLLSIPPLSDASTSYNLTVSVTNTTGAAATLAGWVDFNRNGVFDIGERTEVLVPAGATTATLSWSGLSGVISGTSFIRLRLASDPTEIAVPTGAASNGEVEDYLIDVAMPVQLVSFLVTQEANVALLSWTTSEELNAALFEIQHSRDARTWITIGTKEAAGNSNTLTHYHFSDISPNSGINYYRLKMLDFDSTYAYSAVKSVNFDATIANVYPNPVSSILKIKNVSVDGLQQIQLLNKQGHIVYESLLPASEIDVSNFSPGLYVLKITYRDKGPLTHKFIVTK